MRGREPAALGRVDELIEEVKGWLEGSERMIELKK